MFKVNNRNTKKRCEICSKLTIKNTRTMFSGILLSTLNIFHIFFSVSIVDFDQVDGQIVIISFKRNKNNSQKLMAE